MSNAQSWAKIFAPVEKRDKENVMQDTWGHFAPEKNTSYKLTLLFAKSAFGGGETYLIDMVSETLNSSPWLYDFLIDHINTLPLEDGKVYTIKGTFRNYRLYGNHKLINTL